MHGLYMCSFRGSFSEASNSTKLQNQVTRSWVSPGSSLGQLLWLTATDGPFRDGGWWLIQLTVSPRMSWPRRRVFCQQRMKTGWGLSTLTREAAVQGSQQLLSHHNVRKDCPQGDKKIVCPTRQSRSMSNRFKYTGFQTGEWGRRSSEPGSNSLAQSLHLVHLSPLEIISAKRRGSYTDQKCWCQGFYKVPAVNTTKERGQLNCSLIHGPSQQHSRWTFGCESTLKCKFSTFCLAVYKSGKLT